MQIRWVEWKARDLRGEGQSSAGTKPPRGASVSAVVEGVGELQTCGCSTHAQVATAQGSISVPRVWGRSCVLMRPAGAKWSPLACSVGGRWQQRRGVERKRSPSVEAGMQRGQRDVSRGVRLHWSLAVRSELRRVRDTPGCAGSV